MRKLIFTSAAFMAFGVLSAQQDPQRNQQDLKTRTKMDTTMTERQTDPKNMKKSEAVKTKDHNKTTRKSKTIAKDTVMDKRRNP